MKQIPVLAMLSLAALPLFAHETDERQTWLVATSVPAELALDAKNGIAEMDIGGRLRAVRPRTVARFRHVNGFAANLTPAEAKELERSPLVRWVEPNHERRISSDSSFSGALLDSPTQLTPYGIEMVGAPQAWAGGRGRSVRVGVIDTGIDRNHPDLAGRYGGGHDFVNGDDDPQDDHGHGTHVAGTIAAIDNGIGVVGVAPEADLYALKALNENGSGSVLTLIAAVEWAIDNGLDVLNMSLGSSEPSLIEREVFARAEAAGIISIAASGNGGIERLDYPAGYPTVVSVGAIDGSETLASFSQRGINLDFVAPGVAVDSTTFRNFYQIAASDGTTLDAERMDFSPTGTVTGTFVDCRSGFTGECPPETRGNIALIRRGTTTFAEKVTTAKWAGAIAVVIYNHHLDSDPAGGVVLGTLVTPGAWPLTIGISRSSGEYLLSLADRSLAISKSSASEYGRKNGTSMATPHVAGAVALLRSIAPTATKFQIIESLRLTARDLGAPGPDKSFGNGRIDVNKAARQLSPSSFAEDEPRRRSTRRP